MPYASSIPFENGFICLSYDDSALLSCRLSSQSLGSDAPTPLALAGFSQLEEWLNGRRTEFDLPLRPVGTPFQLAVWQALGEIPYGETRTYGAIARKLGRPGAARAVGAACGRNPLWLIIPCHRAVGADGALTGYAGGLALKRRLLDLEREVSLGLCRHAP